MRLGWLRVALLGASALLACLPTQPCACPPALTAAVLFGEVQEANGVPSPGRPVAIVIGRPSASTSCDLTPPLEEAYPPARSTDAAGRFRAALSSPFGPGLRCVHVAAYAGEPGTSDSTVAELLLPFNSERNRPDSAGVILTLPE